MTETNLRNAGKCFASNSAVSSSKEKDRNWREVSDDEDERTEDGDDADADGEEGTGTARSAAHSVSDDRSSIHRCVSVGISRKPLSAARSGRVLSVREVSEGECEKAMRDSCVRLTAFVLRLSVRSVGKLASCAQTGVN